MDVGLEHPPHTPPTAKRGATMCADTLFWVGLESPTVAHANLTTLPRQGRRPVTPFTGLTQKMLGGGCLCNNAHKESLPPSPPCPCGWRPGSQTASGVHGGHSRGIAAREGGREGGREGELS